MSDDDPIEEVMARACRDHTPGGRVTGPQLAVVDERHRAGSQLAAVMDGIPWEPL